MSIDYWTIHNRNPNSHPYTVQNLTRRSRTADFAPGVHGAAADFYYQLANSTKHNAVWLILPNSSIMLKHDVIHKTGST